MSAISGFCEKCNKFRKRHCDGNRNNCMSILFDTIEALQQENLQLQQELNDLKIYSLQMENGEIDMKVTGERAKLFMSALIQFFEQNGGKNFVTTVGMVGKDRYEITVRKCGGVTPADKIEALEHDIEQLDDSDNIFRPDDIGKTVFFDKRRSQKSTGKERSGWVR